jgi:hypothetical protein
MRQSTVRSTAFRRKSTPAAAGTTNAQKKTPEGSKTLGVLLADYFLRVMACGSLRRNYHPTETPQPGPPTRTPPPPQLDERP